MHERFANELSALMRDHQPRLSISMLAEQLGFTYEFVRKLIRGQNLPTQSTLIAMARIFGVEASALEGWVREDKCAEMFGREFALLLSCAEAKELITGFVRLDQTGKEKVLALIKELIGSSNCEPVVNRLRVLLYGGEGSPLYAPHGLLKKRGLSVELLARSAGVTRTAIYNYINCKQRPTPETLRQICATLEITFDEGLSYCTPSKIGSPFRRDSVPASVRRVLTEGLTVAANSVNGADEVAQSSETPGFLIEENCERRKTVGPTPHSGYYRMSREARQRASFAQRARWSETRDPSP